MSFVVRTNPAEWFVTNSTTQMLATQRIEEKLRREHEQQSIEREQQQREREDQRRERERQRREAEAVTLQKLNPVIAGTAQGQDAPHGCMPGTREELLDGISEWATDGAGPCILWLSGLAGTGKTTVASSAAERLAREGLAVISFFISRHAGRRGDLYNIVHTLAFELARVHEVARATIVKAFERDPRLHELRLNDQVNYLLVEPLRAVSLVNPNVTTIIILDALDECDNVAGLVGDGCLAMLIPALGDQPSIGSVKLFLTSRPLAAIGASIRPFVTRLGREVRLHEIPTSGDIRTYLERSLIAVRETSELPTSWPAISDIDTLARRAASLFIYAATVIRYIKQDQYSPPERLAELLNLQVQAAGTNRHMQKSIGYISRSTTLSGRVRRVVAAVVLGREPMSPQVISTLFQISLDALKRILLGLGAIWIVPGSDTDPVILYHESFPDFILDRLRCSDERFYIDPATGHGWLGAGCLHVMNQELVRDICQIPLTAGKELPSRDSIHDLDDRLLQFVSEPLRYSSLHVLQHLAQAMPGHISEQFVNSLHTFCRQKLLFWVELLCLMG
ncbi:hypothetical protein BKA62DRAFT_806724, partial [Auriculariales sp. MPI-PUGE-AT-0066]